MKPFKSFLVLLALFFGTAIGGKNAFAQPFGAPTFNNVTDTSITVIPPAMPMGATQMTLQHKVTREADNQYVTVVTGITTAPTTVTGLQPNTSYTFRYTSNAAPPVDIGPADSCSTLLTRTAPGMPVFSNLTSTGVRVLMPPLPPGALTLNLEMRQGTPNTSPFSIVATGLGAGETVDITYGDTQRDHFFRCVAIGGPSDLAGQERAPSTLALSPVLVTGSLTNNSATVYAVNPADTVWDAVGKQGIDYWDLQKRIQGSGEAGWSKVVGFGWGFLLADGSPRYFDGLAPGTTYELRWMTFSTSGAGTSYGAVTTITTLAGTGPDEPSPATFTNIGPYSVDVIAPATLPARADHLSLEYKLTTAPDWIIVDDTVAAGSTTTTTGLVPTSLYEFRFKAIPASTTVPATLGQRRNVTTSPESPEVPLPPTLGTATSTTQAVTLPAIQVPARTLSLTLQTKLTSAPDIAFTDVTPIEQPGGTAFTVTGLTAGRSYSYRTKAVSADVPYAGKGYAYSSSVEGATMASAPGAPLAPPTVAIVDPYTVDVTAPALPTNADSLILQGLPVNQGRYEDDYIEIMRGLAAGSVTRVSGLTPGATYRFRYSAFGSGGITAPAYTVYTQVTMPVYSAAWQNSGTLSATIQCKGIRIPDPAVGTVTVAQGAPLRLSSYLAMDWDQRNVTATVNGTPVGFSVRYSDTCVYTWSVVNSMNVPVGNFVSGLSQAQTTTWTAPNASGTYTVKLVVSDQAGANKPSTESGSRTDPTRSNVDTPLTFQLTVNVP